MNTKNKHIKCPRNYGELHSISAIEKVYSESKPGDSVIICKILSYYILSHNISKIIDLDITKDIKLFTKRCNWLNSFVQYHRCLNAQITTFRLIDSIWVKELFNAQKDFLKSYKDFDNYLSGVFLKDSLNAKKLLAKDELHNFKLFITSIPHILLDINLDDYQTKDISNAPLRISSIMDDSSIDHIGFVAEFRLLHQVQEFFFNDINHLLSKSIGFLEEENYIIVIKYLIQINELFELTHKANYNLLQNLSVDDYHHFREYLGASSGIQSAAICSSNFRKIYPKFSKEVVKIIEQKKVIKDDLAVIDLFIEEAFKLSNNIHSWKEIHLLFPINYLGGENNGYGTSSMLGIKDGLNMVLTLLDKGYKNDPLIPYYNPMRSTQRNTFPSALYSYLIKNTGKETQVKFPNVQKRAYDK